MEKNRVYVLKNKWGLPGMKRRIAGVFLKNAGDKIIVIDESRCPS